MTPGRRIGWSHSRLGEGELNLYVLHYEERVSAPGRDAVRDRLLAWLLATFILLLFYRLHHFSLLKMDFQSMMSQASMGGGGPGAGPGGDSPQHDNAEMIYISSLALLKVSAFH